MRLAFVLIAAMGFVSAWANHSQDNRLERLEDRMKEMNCIHVIYEDYSSDHTDAEIAQECVA